MFGVLPRRFAGSAYVPGGQRILQMRDRRKRPTGETDIQCLLGGFNEVVKRGIQCSVVAIVRSTVIWCGTGDLTGTDDGFRQVVIYMSVDARQRKLDSGDCAMVAATEQNLPASGSCLGGERGVGRRRGGPR